LHGKKKLQYLEHREREAIIDLKMTSVV